MYSRGQSHWSGKVQGRHTGGCCSVLQYVAVRCSVLQCVAIAIAGKVQGRHEGGNALCNTLQHAATRLQHCNTLQHTREAILSATHCNTLQHTATHYNIRGRRWISVAAKKLRCSSLGVALMIKRNICPQKVFPHSDIHFRQGRKSKVT